MQNKRFWDIVKKINWSHYWKIEKNCEVCRQRMKGACTQNEQKRTEDMEGVPNNMSIRDYKLEEIIEKSQEQIRLFYKKEHKLVGINLLGLKESPSEDDYIDVIYLNLVDEGAYVRVRVKHSVEKNALITSSVIASCFTLKGC